MFPTPEMIEAMKKALVRYSPIMPIDEALSDALTAALGLASGERKPEGKPVFGKDRAQGMVRSIDQYRNGVPERIVEGSPAQVLYALKDARHDVLVLWDKLASMANEAADTSPTPHPSLDRKGLKNALEMTGCENEEDLIDMANVGNSLMNAIDSVIRCEGPFKNWSPADDPAEIVGDLYNEIEENLVLLEEARRVLTEARAALDGEPEYHHSGMGCGLEDRNIHDRYDAMHHGWERALERAYGEHVIPAREAIDAFLLKLEGSSHGKA